jgi:glycosyltransferase involved in cell wall biosynthesis
MKVSVVTISFNQAQFLEQAMRSVFEQEFPDLEYILVDPGSTDGSRDLIEKYRTKLTSVIFEKDLGAADGLNKGFSKASGEIFGFINSDDILLPEAIKIVAQYFDTNPTVDVVSGCGHFTDSYGTPIRPIIPSKLTPWLFAHGGVSVFQQGTFFRASYFRRIGGFNVDNKTCWDGELFLDMAMAGARFATIGNYIAHFRLHEGGITGSGRLAVAYRKDLERLFEKALGRKRTRFDRFLDIFARVMKGTVDPMYYPRRLLALSSFVKY